MYRAGNQGGDGVQVCPKLTGVCHNEQTSDLEAEEGAHLTICQKLCKIIIVYRFYENCLYTVNIL